MFKNLFFKIVFLLVFAGFSEIFSGCGASKVSNDAAVDGDVVDIPPEEIIVPVDDDDGDCISNEMEGKSSDVDTDGDGKPDYVDDDSDGDTIPDSVEAGRTNCSLPPRDSDGDGVADFRSLDSDGNGISDSIEGTRDSDGDTLPDFTDLDNDGDSVNDSIEIGPDPSQPVDSDHDTIPDYLDTDSDNDTIRDWHEQRGGADIDTDGDTIPNRLDDDSDGDGWSDSDEAGDSDPSTQPVDTDRDGIYDFIDLDSDADGLPDSLEREHGTSRTNSDTDGDGVTDLIEVGYGSNPLDPADNPRAHGDFVFVVPYNDPADPPDPPLEPQPPKDTLVFSTNIRQADVFFAIDTTGSMGGEISNLATTLSSTIIPQISATISDVWFGVSGFDDYPVGGYGTAGDRVFYLEQRCTASASEAQSAVNNLSVHNGLDLPESQTSALYAIATGLGLDGYLSSQDSCLPGEVGYPCFRNGSIPIIILITDAPFHNGPSGANPYDPAVLGFTPPAYDEARDALNDIHAKVIGVNSGSTPAAMHLQTLAVDTGSVDRAGNPLVFQIPADGSGLGDQVVTAVSTLANQVPIDISTEPENDSANIRCVDSNGKPVVCCEGPSPCTGDTSMPVNAVLEFIDRIVPNLVGGVEDPEHAGRFCVGGLTVDNPADPHYFENVTPGTTVCFDIYVRRNTTVPGVREPQLFKAFIQVIGDMVTVLDIRDVFFLVPPYIEQPVLG